MGGYNSLEHFCETVRNPDLLIIRGKQFLRPSGYWLVPSWSVFSYTAFYLGIWLVVYSFTYSFMGNSKSRKIKELRLFFQQKAFETFKPKDEHCCYPEKGFCELAKSTQGIVSNVRKKANSFCCHYIKLYQTIRSVHLLETILGNYCPAVVFI